MDARRNSAMLKKDVCRLCYSDTRATSRKLYVGFQAGK
ncbi:hypothetical protein B0G66_10269 [Bacillus badius]|nr:hypothetical protein B0G66_10269 [Bacillus badius]